MHEELTAISRSEGFRWQTSSDSIKTSSWYAAGCNVTDSKFTNTSNAFAIVVDKTERGGGRVDKNPHENKYVSIHIMFNTIVFSTHYLYFSN